MTLQERADAYARAFARFPASHLRVVEEQGGPVLYGTWLIGQDYRNKSAYYGAHPPGYVERVMALFPDARTPVLQLFAGSLEKRDDWLRVDVNPMLEPDVVADVYELAQRFADTFTLAMADPPYDDEDAARYNVAPLDRGRAMAAIALVTEIGGHLVWLDTRWPMFRKTEWRTVGRITLIRSTNHRVRLISIFERRAA